MIKINQNLKHSYVAYLVRYPGYLDFSLLEFKALMSMKNINFEIDSSFCYNIKENPFLKFYTNQKLCEKTITSIYERSVLVKTIFSLYSSGSSMDQLVENTKLIVNELKEEIDSMEYFKFNVEGNEISIPKEEQLEMIKKVSFLEFKATVNLKNALRTFVIYFNNPTKEYYFGKVIGTPITGKLFYNRFDLKERKYLGPTSTDNRLAFIMANLGRINSGDIVYDPFTGTGSLIIPPSYFG